MKRSILLTPSSDGLMSHWTTSSPVWDALHPVASSNVPAQPSIRDDLEGVYFQTPLNAALSPC